MIKLLILLVFIVILLCVAAIVWSVISLSMKKKPVKPKALEKPEEVLDWTDIQWNVEKRLPKEDR